MAGTSSNRGAASAGVEGGGRALQSRFGVRGVPSSDMPGSRHSVGTVPHVAQACSSGTGNERDVTFGGPARGHTLKAPTRSAALNRNYGYGSPGGLPSSLPVSSNVASSRTPADVFGLRTEPCSSDLPLHRRLSQLSGQQLQHQKPELDLREVDGKVTREVEAGGVVVERRYKVMWDQRQQIDERDLTDDHRIVGVKVDHHKVIQPKIVTLKEAVKAPSRGVPESNSPLRQARCNSGGNTNTRNGNTRLDNRAVSAARS